MHLLSCKCHDVFQAYSVIFANQFRSSSFLFFLLFLGGERREGALSELISTASVQRFHDTYGTLIFLSLSEEKPDCSKARCEVQFSPRCPEDSILIEGYAPPGECCPLPSRCVCNPAGCLRKVCQPGYLNILVSKASGKPGECCDLYECKPGKSGHNFFFHFSVFSICLTNTIMYIITSDKVHIASKFF